MRNKEFPSQQQAVASHREVLATTKAVVAEWARRYEGQRDLLAAAMLELLAECSQDRNGDKTLEIVSELFDTYCEVINPVVAHQFAALADAAHGLGRSRGVRYVH